MCRSTGHETVRRSTDLHHNLQTRVQPDPNDDGAMAITEQFFIDPGTEMISTPPIHLQGFDLDQFVRHLHIFTGHSTLSKTVAHDPLLSHSPSGERL
jgi:hypothetical protein